MVGQGGAITYNYSKVKNFRNCARDTGIQSFLFMLVYMLILHNFNIYIVTSFNIRM